MFVDCADASVVRTSSRQELLYPRSKIAAVARAFGLEAIDMVRCFLSLSLIWCSESAAGLRQLQRLGTSAG